LAGSQRDFIYTADNSDQFAVRLDNSNSKQNGFGFTAYGGTPILRRQPVGFRLRGIWAIDPSGNIKRFLPCGTKVCAAWLSQISEVTLIDYSDLSDVAFKIVKRVAEFQFNPPRGGDTYIIEP